VTDKVVDASAIAAVAFVEPQAAAVAQRLNGHRLLAPTLFRYEIASTALRKMRSRPVERGLILEQHTASLSLDVEECDVDQAAALQLAQQMRLSAYDASYLWLALQLKCELVTLDKRLEKAFLAMRTSSGDR
jgi:predicted nucleic acid-binding protein